MAASFNVNYDFNQHPEQTAGNGHDKNVDLEALEFLLIDVFLLEEVEVGQVHVSTYYKDANHELEDAFLSKEKRSLHHRKFITHQTKVNIQNSNSGRTH